MPARDADLAAGIAPATTGEAALASLPDSLETDKLARRLAGNF